MLHLVQQLMSNIVRLLSAAEPVAYSEYRESLYTKKKNKLQKPCYEIGQSEVKQNSKVVGQTTKKWTRAATDDYCH